MTLAQVKVSIPLNRVFHVTTADLARYLGVAQSQSP